MSESSGESKGDKVRHRQITNQILMVRPARFGFNHETAASNTFQSNDDGMSPDEVAQKAIEEFDRAVETLLACEVDVYVVEDSTDPVKTDAVFPNNWVSFHQPGTIVTWPMMSESRRNEIRDEILDDLAIHFVVRETWQFHLEESSRFLEGTGSLVLDRVSRIAYACRSPRTNEELVNKFCLRMGYRAVLLDAVDGNGVPVYHTNVIMAVTQKLVVICLESIPDETGRQLVRKEIEDSGKTVVEISLDQVRQFAGNMLQIGDADQRPLLVMSKTARQSLTDEQVAILEDESDLLQLAIPVIEKYGGGSVRCMLAEIFLEPR